MNPKQHAKRNTVLRVIAFLLIVALVYGALTRLLTINNATEQQYIRSFYLEPKNSLDVMILGASETFTDYCAPLAWQHAGFTSYPLAVSAAQGTLYASMLRESAKRQNPSVYVVEVNGFLYTEAERDELGTAATREWLDTLPLSRNKVQAIDECVQATGCHTMCRCSSTTTTGESRTSSAIRCHCSSRRATRAIRTPSRFCPSPCSSRRRMRSPCASNRSTISTSRACAPSARQPSTGNQKRALCPLPAPHRH